MLRKTIIVSLFIFLISGFVVTNARDHLGYLGQPKTTPDAWWVASKISTSYIPDPSLHANTFIDIYKNSIDSVVTVIVTAESSITQEFLNNLPTDSPFNELFEEQGEKIVPKMYGSGSGFIVTEDGRVYTNHHVISEKDANMVVTEIHVIWKNGDYRKAKLIASDPVVDFAILEIIKDEDTPDEKFKAVPLGDSSLVLPGTMVAAIGSPLDQSFSITSGIISAVERQSNRGRWVTYLQTDTVINKGNSGGPLFNLQGEVIGINSMLISPSGYFIGIGYAIPSNLFQEVAIILLEHGEYVRPWIGVSLGDPSSTFRENIDIASDVDVIILMEVVNGGPAETAGLKKYDVITAVNGNTMETPEFINLVSASSPGETIELSVRRITDWDEKTYEDLVIILTVGNMDGN
jgi:serine protease Do